MNLRRQIKALDTLARKNPGDGADCATALRHRLEMEINGAVRRRVNDSGVAEELMYLRYARRMLDAGDYDGAIGSYASAQRSDERRRLTGQ